MRESESTGDKAVDAASAEAEAVRIAETARADEAVKASAAEAADAAAKADVTAKSDAATKSDEASKAAAKGWLALITENPLFVSVLGLSGAVVFTRDIFCALTAAVTALAVLAASAAAEHVFRQFFGRTGANIVFFSVAAAVTAIVGAATKAALPGIWDKIGACYPLFPVGSLAIVTERRGGLSLSRRESGVLRLMLGYGGALVIVAAIRQILGYFPLAGTPAGALLIIGALAALINMSLHLYRDRHDPEGEGGDAGVSERRIRRPRAVRHPQINNPAAGAEHDGETDSEVLTHGDRN